MRPNVARIFQLVKHFLPAKHKQYYGSSSNVLSWSQISAEDSAVNTQL